MMDKISLDDMRLLVAVVQAGSLSHASELTGVPVSRLSRRLTELEAGLGTRLINRGKKGVSLNDVGERFFEYAQNMLIEAQQAVQSVQDSLDKPDGLLRLSIASDVYHHLIAPILPEYLNACPSVRLDIQLTDQKISMIQDGIDIALRVGSINDENVVAKALKPIDFGVFASQDYLELHGKPQHPSDLYQHTIIAQSQTLPWHFQGAQEDIEILPILRTQSNDFLLIEKLVAQGMGIGVLFDTSLVRHDSVCQILTDWQLPTVPLSVLYYKNRGSMPAVRSFTEWLVTKLG